ARPPEERRAAIAELVNQWSDGRVKLLLTTTGLCLRRSLPDVFLSGRYVPLTTEIASDGALAAFARVLDDQALIFLAPRLIAPLISADHPVPLGGEAWKTSRVLL